MDTKKLRQKILDLAIHGKLVPQDPNDEPASILLERIRKEKEQLIKEGKIKAPKKSKSAGDTSHYTKEVPFEVPEGWVWLKGDDIFLPMESTSPQGDFFDYIDIDAIDNKHNVVTEPKHLAVKNAPSRATRLVRKGDILFSMVRPYLRNIARVESDGCIASTGFYVCRCSNAIDSKFCYYLMLSDYVVEGLNQHMKGDNSPSINNNHITSWLYPIPPLAEQRRICDSIDSLFSTVDSFGTEQLLLHDAITLCRTKILDYAIHGKLVPQDPTDEPSIEVLRRINPNFQPSDNLHYEGILPSGWTLCCLEDVLDYEQPQAYIVNSTDYSDDYKTPVLTPGKSFVLGYTNELSGICNHLPVIIFDDFTTESKYVDFPFKVKSSAMKILRARGEINLKYVAIFMSITRLVGDTHKRYWISEYSKIPIPIPPLREQGRIVLAAKHLLNQLDNLIACISDN